MLASFAPYSNPNNNYERFANKYCHLKTKLTNHSNNQSLLKAANEERILYKIIKCNSYICYIEKNEFITKKMEAILSKTQIQK